jgi:signal transduction histidine kinase
MKAFGLRPRLFAALILTSAVTLVVAAAALLSPLEQRLRTDGQQAVYNAMDSTRPEFEEVNIDPATNRPSFSELTHTAIALRQRSGGQVTILNNRLETVYSMVRLDLNVPDFYAEARRAEQTHKRAAALRGGALIAAQPMRVGPRHERYVVVVRRRLDYVSSSFHTVQNAFIAAAGAGFGIALLLGIALTTTLLRRLERLRDATRELEQRGLDAPPPNDQGRDEIGELARAFAAMQTQLRRQETARRAFVATASHELRTPLASLHGMLELLEEDLDSEHLDLEDARERTTRAREQSRRLSQLASDLLDLSRLDAEIELRREPLELGEICRAVAAEFDLSAAERHVHINIKPPPSPCWAAADPGAVARIVRILLDNALRVGPANSSIDLEASANEHWRRLTVRDRGPGVPADERDAIFERFTRGSTTGSGGGFGLGLAIGRELATRMDGALELLDSGGDHGASFSLRLPPAQVNVDELADQ